MRYLYTLLFYLALPGVFLRLWWKGRKSPGYRLRWRERLGFIPSITTPSSLWLHAVSMGEMIAARPLILALQKAYPDKTLVITTMTATGSALASRYAGHNVQHVYVPYDLPDAIQRFLRRIRPEQAIIMETELWPNLLHYTARQNIPILLANARLSPASMQKYQRIIPLTRRMLPNIRCIAAQTQQDADRFRLLGASEQQLRVMGNIKFDVPVPVALVEQGRQLRHSWGMQRPTVIAASTHADEEVQVLEAFAKLLAVHKNALLILVPRHLERFTEVLQLCQSKGYHCLRRSQQQPCTSEVQILLGDSVGELFLYYAMADIAWVGGSFAAIGGHNLLEPAALALPVMTGPHTFNFAEIVQLLRQADGIIEVKNATSLANAWLELLANSDRCLQLGRNAQRVVESNRGALDRHLNYIADCSVSRISQMTTSSSAVGRQ